MSVQFTQNNAIYEICDRLDRTIFSEVKVFIDLELENGRNVDDIFMAISVNTSSAISVAARAYHGSPQEAALFMIAAIASHVQAVLAEPDRLDSRSSAPE